MSRFNRLSIIATHIDPNAVIKMLGDQIYEATGKVLGLKLLDENWTTESSFADEGMILGMKCKSSVTTIDTPHPNGTTYSEGHGMTFTEDGGAALFTYTGISVPTGRPPACRAVGAMYFKTESEQLGRLNSVAAVFEMDVHEDETYEIKMWEWK